MARFGFEPERMNRRAGILERQRPQQRRVHDAEDGGVGADADRDDRDGDQRELARLQERAERVSHVAQTIVAQAFSLLTAVQP